MQLQGLYDNVPCDCTYGCMDGENDEWPDIAIGRFSAESDGDLATQVTRTIAYERQMNPAASWCGDHTVTSISAWEDRYESGATMMESYGMTVQRVYETQGGRAADVIDGLNVGKGAVYIHAHGDEDHINIFNNATANQLSRAKVHDLENEGKLPYITAASCSVGNLTWNEECLAEAFLRARDGETPKGAVAVSMASIAASQRMGTLMYEYTVDMVMNSTLAALGAIWTTASHMVKEWYSYDPDWYRLTNIYITFGDPSLLFYSDTPIPLQVSHDGVLGLGQTTYHVNVQGAANARCTLYERYYQQILGTGLTDASGSCLIVLDEVEIPHPLFAEVVLTVTAHNAQTVQDEVAVSEPTYVVQPDGLGDFPTIQDAIDAANDGEVIGLTYGTFTGPGNRDLLMRGKSIVVRCVNPDPYNECTIDCGGSSGFPHTGIYFVEGEGRGTVLEGITIVGGHSARQEVGGVMVPGRGGAIVCGEPTQGGAPVAPRIVRCSFESNVAEDYGGAIYSGVNADPEIRECSFIGNGAGEGGGLYQEGSAECYVLRCEFIANYASGRGGAAVCSHAHLDGCTIAWNECDSGGASGVHCGALRLTNCTVANNESAGAGGGVFTATEALLGLQWEANVITHNDRVFTGLCEYPPTFGCTTIHENSHGDWTAEIGDQLFVRGNIPAEPYFCEPLSEDYSVHLDSPCLPGSPGHPAECGLIGAWYAGCSTVDVGEWPIGDDRVRLTITPNPSVASGGSRISYELGSVSTEARAFLQVFDVSGRCVWEWHAPDTGEPAGSVLWAGSDSDGRRLDAGTYFLRLSLGRERAVRRVVFVR